MNDLQLALLGVGGALVVGVWAHGKWQEHRHRKVAESLLGGEGGDPLLERPAGKAAKKSKAAKPAKTTEPPPPIERREPVIGGAADDGPPPLVDGEAPAAVADPAPVAAKASFTPPASGPNIARSPRTPRSAPPTSEPDTLLVSAEADFVARFSLPEAVSGETLLAIPREAFAVLRKRVAWVGYECALKRWELVTPEGSYQELRIGLQLADRAGPIGNSLVEQFRRAVERVGDELTAVAEMPSAQEAVARAINLDRLCAEVDIQLAVHLAPRHDHFAPDLVRDTALERGFRLATDGVLGYYDAAGERLFSLQMPDARAPDGLPPPTAICLLEVPCVTHGEPAFDKMMAVAQELADALDGILVDEQRRPITDRFVGPVRKQIGQLQNRMAEQGVIAGSPLALRLFS